MSGTCPRASWAWTWNTAQSSAASIKGKEDTISDLKKAAKKSGKVYLATDPDREGEAISWHLKELLDIPDDKTYRGDL